MTAWVSLATALHKCWHILTAANAVKCHNLRTLSIHGGRAAQEKIALEDAAAGEKDVCKLYYMPAPADR